MNTEVPIQLERYKVRFWGLLFLTHPIVGTYLTYNQILRYHCTEWYNLVTISFIWSPGKTFCCLLNQFMVVIQFIKFIKISNEYCLHLCYLCCIKKVEYMTWIIKQLNGLNYIFAALAVTIPHFTLFVLLIFPLSWANQSC